MRVIAAAFTILLASVDAWSPSLEVALARAKERRSLTFVDVYAGWCEGCRRFETEVAGTAELERAAPGMARVRLDFDDAKEGAPFARELGISGLPTFVVLAPDRTIAGTIRGYTTPADFYRSLRRVQSEYAIFVERLGNEKSIAGDPVQRLQLARDLRGRRALAAAESRLQSLLASPRLEPALRDEAFQELALTQESSGRMDAAVATIRRFGAVQKRGEIFERMQLLLAQIYAKQGRNAAAVATLRAFLRAFPQSTSRAAVEAVLLQLERGANGK